MSYNTRKIALSLFMASFIGVFGAFSGVYAVSNPQWQCSGTGTDFSGVDYKIYYDGYDYLTIDVSFDLTPTWSGLPSNPTKVLFRKYDSPYSGPFAKLNIPSYSGGTYLMGAICDSGHTVNNPSGLSGEFCKVDRNETGVKLRVYGIRETGSWSLYLSNEGGLTRSILDNAFGYEYLENNAKITEMPQSYVCNESTCSDASDNYDFPNYAQSFPLGSSTPPVVNGVCGTGEDNTLTSIPPTGSVACSNGTLADFGTYVEGGTTYYAWTCDGSGGGYSSSCLSAPITTTINGTCGTANGTTITDVPYEYQKCSMGMSNGSTIATLSGWSWTCFGSNGGTSASCSAINGSQTTPPVIPSQSNCSGLSGGDWFLCNMSNTLQNMFLPSTDKVSELQNDLQVVQDRFPFNYLGAISSAFSTNNILEGDLTLTLGNSTATLDSTIFNNAFFVDFRYFTSFMIILMFLWWGRGYIKHFFK